MIARELLEFFAGFSPDGGPTLQRSGGLPFLSNVNACYSRECWAEIRFEDLPYSEDQAFGRAMLEAGWVKVFHPDAAVRHAHEYGPLDFVKRYFDEYRGLRETSGHVEPLRPSAALRGGERRRALDARPRRAGARDRALAGALGRAPRRTPGGLRPRLPRGAPALPGAARALARGPRGARGAAAAPAPEEVPRGHHGRGAGEPLRGHPAPRPRGRGAAGRPGAGDGRPPAPRGHRDPSLRARSGGHGTIFKLLAQLERMGHTCSTWVHDPRGLQAGGAPMRAPRHRGGIRAPGRAGAPGVRRLARRRRGARHLAGTPSTHRCSCPAAGRGPT